MLRYASKRVVLAILVALAVSFAAFLLLSVATDPASAIAGEGAEPEVIEHIREQLGLNPPLLVQYGSWLLHVFHGDFGTSYYWHQPVGTLILHHLPVTLTLALSAIFVTLIVAIPLGTIAALYPNSLIDRLSLGIAVSAQRRGLLTLSQHALRFHRRIAYHDYEGLAFTPEEGARLTASLGNRFAMLLRNHGTLTIGRTVAEAHVLMATLIKACEIQIQALAGGEVVSPAPEVADRAAEQLEDGGAIEGVIEWPALLRKLDKIDASYRD